MLQLPEKDSSSGFLALKIALHNISIEVTASNEEALSVFYENYPISSFKNIGKKPLYKIIWRDSQSLSFSREDWELSDSFSGELNIGSKTTVCRKHFIIEADSTTFTITSPYKEPRGVLKAIEYLVKQWLLQSSNLLLESAVLIDREERAALFFGWPEFKQEVRPFSQPRERYLDQGVFVLRSFAGQYQVQKFNIGEGLGSRAHKKWYDVEQVCFLEKSEAMSEAQHLFKVTKALCDGLSLEGADFKNSLSGVTRFLSKMMEKRQCYKIGCRRRGVSGKYVFRLPVIK